MWSNISKKLNNLLESEFSKLENEEIPASIGEQQKIVFEKINQNNNLKTKLIPVIKNAILREYKTEIKEEDISNLLKNFKIEFKKENLTVVSEKGKAIYNLGNDQDGLISSILCDFYENGSGTLDVPVTKAFYLSMKNLRRPKEEENGKGK